MRERVKKCFAQFWLADKGDNESSLLLILGRSKKTVEGVGWMDIVYQAYR
jgi:hypothetical protein